MTSEWECPECHKIITWTWNDVAESGSPMCDDCDIDMEYKGEHNQPNSETSND